MTKPNQVNHLPGSTEAPTRVPSRGRQEERRLTARNKPLLAGATLDSVGLPCDGEDPLPRATVHVEASRRVFHQLRDGDIHLTTKRDQEGGEHVAAVTGKRGQEKEKMLSIHMLRPYAYRLQEYCFFIVSACGWVG